MPENLLVTGTRTAHFEMLRLATVSGAGLTDYRYYADGTRAEKLAPGNVSSQFYYMGGLGYLDAEDTAQVFLIMLKWVR